MGFLKVVLWILVIILALMVLAALTVTILLSIRARVGVDYEEESGAVVRVGYGTFNFSFGGNKPQKKKKKEDEPSKPKKERGNGRIASKVKAKAKDTVQKKQFEREIRQEEEQVIERERIDKESVRIETEMAEADRDLKAATAAKREGKPLPDVVDEEKVSTLRKISQKLDSLDIEGAMNLGKSFMDGFSYDSIVALFQYIKEQSTGSIKKVGKRFVIQDLELGLSIHGDDAADTALKYGKISAVVFPALGMLVANQRVRNYDIHVVPDFLDTKDRGEIHVTFGFTPLRVLTPIAVAGLKMGGKSLVTVDKGLTKMDKAYTARKKETEEKLLDQTAAEIGVTISE